MLGGFGVGVWHIWGRLGVDVGLIFGLGRVLGGSCGRPWGRAQDRFLFDFESVLSPVWGPKTDQNRSKCDAKMHSNCASVFGSNFKRFFVDLGVHLGTIFGSCWASYGGSAK